MAKSDLREWAVKGAEQRLVELADEARAIFATFPELRKAGRGLDVNRGRTVRHTEVTPRKRRRRMSAATRKAFSLAQKKRWAEWRTTRGHATTEQLPAATANKVTHISRKKKFSPQLRRDREG